MPTADFSKKCDNTYCTLEGKTEPLTFPGDVSVFSFVSNSDGLCFSFSSLKMLCELSQLWESESDLIQKGRE